MKSKLFIYTALSFITGVIFSVVFLHSYINSQRNQGRHEGALNGKREVLDFLAENITNTTTNKEVKKLDQYYNFKDYGISIIEINGVKTLKIE